MKYTNKTTPDLEHVYLIVKVSGSDILYAEFSPSNVYGILKLLDGS